MPSPSWATLRHTADPKGMRNRAAITECPQADRQWPLTRGQGRLFGRKNPKSMRGITMPELMITLVIGAILVAIGIPNMRTFMQDTSRSGRINGLISALTYARSEAVTRGQETTICPGQASDDDCNPTTDNGEFVYNTGWLVMVVTVAGSPAVVGKRFEPDMGSATLYGELSQFTYTPLGQPKNVANMADGTWFRYCDTRGDDQASVVLINGTGRPASYHYGVSELDGVGVPSCP